MIKQIIKNIIISVVANDIKDDGKIPTAIIDNAKRGFSLRNVTETHEHFSKPFFQFVKK